MGTLRPQQLATPEAFARDPKLVWEWYEWHRKLVENAHPNPGHCTLARLEALAPDFALITQNVDGLHARAGNENVIELHSNILRTKCSVEGVPVEEYEDGAKPPICLNCGAGRSLRPRSDGRRGQPGRDATHCGRALRASG